jgi:hypothetical protein
MTQELTREVRDGLIAQDLAEGLLPPQICAKRGFDDATVWRAMNRIRSVIQESLGQGVARYRDRQLSQLDDMRSEIGRYRDAGKPLPLRALDRLLKILEVEADLLGTRAPTRSVRATVSLDENANAELIGLDTCPQCGGGLDPNGRPQPMNCVHEFIDPAAGDQYVLPKSYPVPQLEDGE